MLDRMKPAGSSMSGWRVLMRLRDDDLQAVDAAAKRSMRPRFGVLSNLGTETNPIGLLVLRIDANTRQGALSKAAEQYVGMRSSSGLDWLDPQIISVRSTLEETPVSEGLIFDAAELLADGRNELVVLRVQTAAELAAERAYRRLIGPKLSPEHRSKATRLISRTLSDERSRNLFQAITGLRVDTQAWWPDYRAHLQRRNAVVHAGAQVERKSAEASVRAVLSFMAFIDPENLP